MRRTILRQALFVLAAGALFLPIAVYHGVTAEAATFTFSDTNCDSFSFNSQTQTLSCVVSNPPTCTVTGSSTGTLNTSLTLTASCTPVATAGLYVWTQDSGGTGCSSSTASTCTDTQSVAGTVTYTVKGTNGNGAGPVSPPFPVVWSNTVTKPSSCSITPGSSSQSAGYQSTFGITCTGGSPPTSWSWTGGTAAGQTTATTSLVTVNATTTFTGTATNSAGSGSASSTITIGGGGGGGWSGSCPGYANTNIATAAWLGGTGWVFNTWQNALFGSNDIYVVKITPSSTKTQATAVGSMNSIENNGPPAPRWGSLSTVPCDLSGTGLTVKHGGGAPIFAGTNAPPTIYIWVGTTQPSNSVLLQPGVEYYYNITNQDPATGGTGCSPGPNCDMRFTLFKPSGT